MFAETRAVEPGKKPVFHHNQYNVHTMRFEHTCNSVIIKVQQTNVTLSTEGHSDSTEFYLFDLIRQELRRANHSGGFTTHSWAAESRGHTPQEAPSLRAQQQG